VDVNNTVAGANTVGTVNTAVAAARVPVMGLP